MIRSKIAYIFLYVIFLTFSTKTWTQATISYEPRVDFAPIFQYKTIFEYKHMLHELITYLFTKYVYEKKQEQETDNAIARQIHDKIPSISRTQALEIIKEITAKVFNPDDEVHISTHFQKMNDMTAFLDPALDKKTIDAINFLLENQHKSSIVHLPFWIQKIKEKELKTAIPMSYEIASKPDAEKLKTLQNKMAKQKNEW